MTHRLATKTSQADDGGDRRTQHYSKRDC